MSDGQSVFEGIIDAGTLSQFIDVFTPLVSEAKLHFSETGVRGAVPDPANVAMINPAMLEAAAFESLTVPGQVVLGVNLETLSERLKPAEDDDLVYFEVDMKERRLHMEFRNIKQSVAMIDPDAMRNEPDNPDLDLPNTVTLTGAQLDEAKTVVDQVSDHLFVEGRPDDREVEIRGEGDIDDSVLVYGDEETVDADVAQPAESIFSLDYFKEFVKPMPSDAEVTITFGDEFPMTMEWAVCGGDVQVQQMLAPRIQSE